MLLSDIVLNTEALSFDILNFTERGTLLQGTFVFSISHAHF